MNPAIILGRRRGDPWREQLWDYCRTRWQHQLPTVPIYEGYHETDEPFSFSEAVNLAAIEAELAVDPDVFIYTGADWIAESGDQVLRACNLALSTGQLTFAHDCTLVLSQQATEEYIGLALTFGTLRPELVLDLCTPGLGDYHPNTFSGVVAVPASLWTEVAGFDERFQGWGFEDMAFWRACTGIAGGYQRLPGTIGHLWHPQDWESREGSAEHGRNMVLYERYVAAVTDRAAMAALLAERP